MPLKIFLLTYLINYHFLSKTRLADCLIDSHSSLVHDVYCVCGNYFTTSQEGTVVVKTQMFKTKTKTQIFKTKTETLSFKTKTKTKTELQ